MPRYIIERNMDVSGLSQSDLQSLGRRSNDIIEELGGITWIRTYISEKEGKVYCEYDAPDVDSVLEHARRTGLPADRISEVAIEIHPDMFR
jgi:Nickel responsive protein SCO4226-like